MKKGLTELVCIVDASGSMGRLTDDTIGGYNTFLDEQKQAEGEANITTTLFNTKCVDLHFRKNIKEVEHITDKEYRAMGNTAMLDAIGYTISNIGVALADLPEEERPERVLFVITTDGQENASREYTHRQVKEMIEHQKEKYNWEFLFIGANIDAAEVGSTIGIAKGMTANYTANDIGTQSLYTVVSDTALRYRGGGGLSASWADEIK